MKSLKGRALIYPLLVLVAWAGGRMAAEYGYAPDRAVAALQNAGQPPDATGPWKHRSGGEPAIVTAGKSTAGRKPRREPERRPKLATRIPLTQAFVPLAAATVERPGAFGQANPIAAKPQTSAPQIPAPDKARARDRRLSAYAYSFWRTNGTAGAGLAPASQYGGSQSGIILAYDLAGPANQGPALAGRLSAAHDGSGKEAAIGLRWKRPAGLPLSLMLERRLRGGDADRWAIFAAGGIDRTPIGFGFDLDSYAQLGWASGPQSSGFYDGQARLTRQVGRIGAVPVRLGAGGWAGGQRDAHRLDVGPTVQSEFVVRNIRFDLRLDWRQRVAGDASPASGPALTLSSGF